MTDDTNILGAIGDTPLVELKRVVPKGCASVFVKVESQNPTGSMKDRMALSVVDRAAESGRLPPGGTVVEYTGGSTGTSLAFVCAARGFPITVVTSDAFSQEKRDHMRALGANLDAAAGYVPLAEEVWAQSHGELNAFVQSVGTAQCIRGVAGVLCERNPDIRIVAVEPAESPVVSGGAPGAHKIEGVGPGFVPPLWTDNLADEIALVSTAEAMNMTRRLAREEALFAGTSSGANVVAALRVAERLGAGKMVVTLLCDTGLKYLSTDLYAAEPGAE